MRLYLLDLDSGTPAEASSPRSEEECLSTNGDFWPAWSPDGQRLAFGRKYGNAERIAIMDVASGEILVWDTSPSEGASKPAGHPSWSRDGNFILFEEGPAGQTTLARLDLNTKSILPIVARPGAHLSDWR
jgi:Tol biopolymer transport system component